MIRIFSLRRLRQEKEIESIKRSNRHISEQAKIEANRANQLFMNGFAIRIYRAQRSKHARG